MFVGKIWFPRKAVNKHTTPRLIALMNARTYGGPNIDSYHYVVGVVPRAQITISPRIPSDNYVKVNTEVIHNRVLRDIYKGYG